jgi:cardiolipin synthase
LQASATPSTASWPSASTCRANWAPCSIRSPTRRCWSSIYVALGIWGAVPRWIVILVVSRDIMIVTAVIVSWLFDKPIPMKPLMVSKLNTVAQVAFAALVLASLGFNFKPAPYDVILMGFVTVFTLVSVSLYLVEWVRHMSTIDAS